MAINKTLPVCGDKIPPRGKKETPVVVMQSYDREIYNRLEKYRKAHGLLSVQEVDRLAVSFFLTKNGY